MSHNDDRDWPRRGGLAVFEQFVENPITPNPSLIGYEVTFNGVVAKLIDERTCLFHRETRPLEIVPFVFIGEIHFGPKGHLMIGRLPRVTVDLLIASLVFVILLANLLSQFGGLFWPLGLTFLLGFGAIFFYSLALERYNLRQAYPKVIDWVQSGKVSNRLNYSISKDAILSCSICGTTADFVCKHCRKPFCEHHISYYTTGYRQYDRYWVGYFCAECRKGHEEAWRGSLIVFIVAATVIGVWILAANIFNYIQHLR